MMLHMHIISLRTTGQTRIHLLGHIRKFCISRLFSLKAQLTVLGNGSIYSPPCIILRESGSTIWFNCSPTALLNYRAKNIEKEVNPLLALFVTKNDWQRSVDGFMMFENYLAERKVMLKDDKVNIFGPNGVSAFMQHYISVFTSKYSRKWLKDIQFTDIKKSQTVKKNNLTVTSVPISVQKFSSAHVFNTSMAYVLNINQSISNGIPFVRYHPEHEFSYNQNCLKPVIILEVPTLQHMQVLIKDKLLDEWIKVSKENLPAVVTHITPNHVLNTSEYKQWILKFGSECHHVIINEDNSPGIVMPHNYQHQMMLHYCNDLFFPCPHAQHVESLPSFTDIKNFIRPHNLWSCDISLNGVYINKNSVPTEKSVRESIESHINSLEIYEKKIINKSKDLVKNSLPHKKIFPNVVNLGTGPSQTSYKRTQSAHLVFTTKDSAILLDCGDSTLQQLYQHFGCHCNNVLDKIKVIFISHMHLDHHIGLVSLLRAIHRNKRKDKLICLVRGCIYPKYMTRYEPAINAQMEFYDIGTYIPFSKLIFLLCIRKLQLCDVNHILPTMGIIITHNNGFKLGYTSDTSAAPHKFVKYAKNCDLLIHDCIDGVKGSEFKIRDNGGHSNLEGALLTKKLTNSDFILLTHIQHYASILAISERTVQDTFGNCFVAFDHLSVFSNEYKVLHKIYPALFNMFKQRQLKWLVKHSNKFFKIEPSGYIKDYYYFKEKSNE